MTRIACREGVLSARQEQALMLIVQGLTYKEAGDKMKATECAVNGLMKRAMVKLDCTNTAQLTYKYYAEQFLGPMKKQTKKG